jgi:hypothetical protein
VYQTPVERQWLDTNLVTRKWKIGTCPLIVSRMGFLLSCTIICCSILEFRLLEAAGFLIVDAKHPDHAGDLFSLIAVYRAAIVRDVDAHYEAVCLMNKKKNQVILIPRI